MLAVLLLTVSTLWLFQSSRRYEHAVRTAVGEALIDPGTLSPGERTALQTAQEDGAVPPRCAALSPPSPFPHASSSHRRLRRSCTQFCPQIERHRYGNKLDTCGK